eukprot:15472402-Alexandrium_andersonii.AAC.1
MMIACRASRGGRAAALELRAGHCRGVVVPKTRSQNRGGRCGRCRSDFSESSDCADCGLEDCADCTD